MWKDLSYLCNTLDYRPRSHRMYWDKYISDNTHPQYPIVDFMKHYKKSFNGETEDSQIMLYHIRKWTKNVCLVMKTSTKNVKLKQEIHNTLHYYNTMRCVKLNDWEPLCTVPEFIKQCYLHLHPEHLVYFNAVSYTHLRAHDT